ncbi:hypothetical protein ABW20_dc0100043 [Dactylellina cionopaga]|nr:hypothetical protein ABW20_dc0100043 [Dactylellina cionopaga]
MARLSTILVGLLCGLSHFSGVVAQTTTVADPPSDLDGTVVMGFAGVNITAVLAQAENQLGVNGTVTDNIPTDYDVVGTTSTVKARNLEALKALRERTVNSKPLLGDITCVALKIVLGVAKVALAGTANYPLWNSYASNSANAGTFWSATTLLTPTCVFKPANAADISIAMRIITIVGTDFNVVGGGHSAIKGWANVDDGVLIVLSSLTGVNIKSGYAEVSAGMRWGDVFGILDQNNLSALGGRMSTVGVPGLILGGGISYFTNKWGFATDQVKNFQVVLWSGCIINANSVDNADLFRALKGGSSNFGIVTRMDLYTWPSKGVYAGQLMYTKDQYARLLPAIYNYHATGASADVETHLISAFVYVGIAQLHLGAFTAFRNVSVPDGGVALQEVLSIPTAAGIPSSLQVRSYGSMCKELGANDVTGQRQDMRDFTVYANLDFFKKAFDIWNTTIVMKYGNIPGFQGTIAFHPITKNAVAAGIARGGNSLGFDANPGNTKTITIINLTHQWSNAADDTNILAALDATLAQLIAYAKQIGVSHPYYYLNYARKQDKPIQSYGSASVARLQAAAQKYDPFKIFQNQVPGGFKVY